MTVFSVKSKSNKTTIQTTKSSLRYLNPFRYFRILWNLLFGWMKDYNTYENTFFISLIVTIIMILFTIFFNQPVFSNNIMFDTATYLKFNYGYINKKKPTRLIYTVIAGHIFLLLCLYFVCFSKKRINPKVKLGLIILLVTAIIGLNLFGLYFIPMHCPFDLCEYQQPRNFKSETTMKQENYISFLASGDNQLWLDVSFPAFKPRKLKLSRKRSQNMVNNVNFINQIVDNLKILENTGDINKTVFEFEDETIRNLVINSASNMIGYITAGDCTNDSLDGRFLSTNTLGTYEYYFNNNPEDGGLLKTSTYECLGNHDYQQEFSYSNNEVNYKSNPTTLYYGNPTTNMILRRNKYRKYLVNSDQHGNYSCQFGKLRIIFLNVWPMEEKDRLYAGVPVNSLNYLKEDLAKKNSSTPWMIVTHFVLNNNEDNANPMEKFEEIYNSYSGNFKGFIYGHVHQPYIVMKKKGFKRGENRYGTSYLLPAPASVGSSRHNPQCTWDYRISYFVFNQYTDDLDCLEFKKNITTNKINVKLITPETLPTDLVQQQCYLCTDKEKDRPRSVTHCLHY